MKKEFILLFVWSVLMVFTTNAQNKIPNGTFDTDISDWSLNITNGADGSLSWDASGQQLKATITNDGSSYYDFQFYYFPGSDFYSPGVEYKLTFAADASSVGQSIDVACGYNTGSYTNFISNTDRYVDITTTKTTYTIYFTTPTSFDYTDFRVGFRAGAQGVLQDLYFDNISLTETIPPTLYGIYTESDEIVNKTSIHDTWLYSINETIKTSGAYEGNESILMECDGSDSWSMAQYQFPDKAAINVSSFASGYFNIALKSTSEGPIKIRFRDEENQEADILFDEDNEQYGFVRDGEWHFISIPVSDIIAANGSLDLTKFWKFIFRSDGDVRNYNNYDFEFDNVYFSIEEPGTTTITEEVDFPNAWINEFHYDDPGADVNEFVEVVFQNYVDYKLSDFTIELYDGSNGEVYASETLNNLIEGTTESGFTFFTWAYAGIMDNAAGISLSYEDSVIQLLSYEGTFTAVDGTAASISSVDIGFEEPCSNAVVGKYSLQLKGQGLTYDAFSWCDPFSTPGEPNINSFGKPQVFALPDTVPVNKFFILIVFMLIAILTIYRKFI